MYFENKSTQTGAAVKLTVPGAGTTRVRRIIWSFEM
jgi:hypothetical protein